MYNKCNTNTNKKTENIYKIVRYLQLINNTYCVIGTAFNINLTLFSFSLLESQ